MRIYNNNTSQIENKEYINNNGHIVYTDKVTETELNSYGYYLIIEEDDLKDEYQDSTEINELIGNKWTKHFTYTDKNLDEVKMNMYTEMKTSFIEKGARPDVSSSLGFTVNGGRDDVTNFEIGKKHALPQVKDSVGVFHTVTLSDYDTIISEIETFGISLYQTKWDKEASILGFTTIQECKDYRDETIEVYEPGIDGNGDPIMVPTGIFIQKDNLTYWN